MVAIVRAEGRSTPGPWAVHPRFRSYVVVATDIEKSIGGHVDPDDEAAKYAKVIHRDEASDYPEFHRSRIISKDEIEANARLIAAAPELLDACRMFVDWYNVDSTEQKRDDAFYAAQAAIAKSEGRS